MSKGRNSKVISIRLPDSIVYTLQDRAKKVGCASVGEYIQTQIIKSVSVNTIDQGNHSVNTTEGVPLYNPAIHRPGDTVKVIQYGKTKVITIPELDADGQIVPNFT